MRSSSCNHMDLADEISCVTGTAHGAEKPYPVINLGGVSIFLKSWEHVFKIRDELQRWLDTAEPFQSHDLSEGDKQVAKLVLFGRILPPAREAIVDVMAIHG